MPSYKNGFVTEFELSNRYLSKFKIEKVGLDHHTELWVPAEELEEFNSEIIDQINVIEAYDSNPNNQFVFVKDTFKVKEENVIAFNFINKSSNFETTENSMIEDYKIKQYLSIPRKIKEDGEMDLDYFVIMMKDRHEINPIEVNKVYLLKHDTTSE